MKPYTTQCRRVPSGAVAAAGSSVARRSRMSVLGLLRLALGLFVILFGLAWPADAHHSPGENEEAGDCRRADAEVAFVRGLAAFSRDQLESATTGFDRALVCNPEHGSARYWLGVTHLRQGDSRAAAEEIAKSLAVKEPPRADRWRILAHLGAAQAATHDDTAATKSLKAASKSLQKFQNLTARDALAILLLGRSLAALGQLEEANAAIERARSLDPGIEEAHETFASPRYRGAFWPPKGRFRREGRLGLSATHDSNPNLIDDELVLRGLDGELVEGAQTDEVGDLGFRLALYRPGRGPTGGRDADGWSLGWTLEGSRSFHQDFDSLDLGQAFAVAHAAWGKDPLSYVSGPLGYVRVPYGSSRLSLLAQAGYLHTRLDDKTYFRGAAASLSMTVRQAPFTDTRLELAYQDFDFVEAPAEDRERTGSLFSLDVSQTFYLKRRDRYLRLGLTGSERDAGRAFARSLVEAYAEVAMPFHPEWGLLLFGSVQRDEFDHPESNPFLPATGLGATATEPREDTVLRGSVTLVWSIRQDLKLFASLGAVDRDSVLELPTGFPGLDYERTTSSVGLIWFFGSGR